MFLFRLTMERMELKRIMSANRLETTARPTLDLVQKGSELYALKSSAHYHPQNIHWSGDLVLDQTCEESDLKENIVQPSEDINPDIKGGPVYLFLVNKLILAMSDQAMRRLVEAVERITVVLMIKTLERNRQTSSKFLRSLLKRRQKFLMMGNHY